MEEIYGNTDRLRDLWRWVAEQWPYFTVVSIAFALIYYASGSIMQAVCGIGIFMCMWLGVLWVDRLPHEDRIWWKRLIGITIILLAVTVAITYNPVRALTITGEPDGDQIHWQIADGEPPYTVFVNGFEIVTGYPGTVISTDADPGKQYTAVVMDNESVADATVTGEYYTYPLWVWMLFATLVACLIISIWLPYAAFGAAIAGGFLLLLIAPNPDYAAYLRIFAGAAFIVGLAGLAGRMQS
jgi:hypothetical protein